MFLVGLLQWWYGRGWVSEVARVGARLKNTADFFSIGELARTLFAPFRQISAGSVGGPIGEQLRAFLDKTISRFVGAAVRLMTILAGLIVIAFQAVFSLLVLVVWPSLPILPVIGLLLFAIGWVPSWN